MSALFSASGQHALRRLAAAPSMLAFDLDGTLAPLVQRPEDAFVSPRTAARLRALSRLWPVAVITGRRVNDAIPRLGFVPRYLHGNHGAERAGVCGSAHLGAQLDEARNRLRQERLQLLLHEVDVEDKGLSLALHYRRSADPCAARRWVDGIATALGSEVRTSHGHRVLNVTPRDAPDKGDALLEIARHCGAVSALFVGDDINDEPAFGKAPKGSVGVRIGSFALETQAGFRLRGQHQVDTLLGLLLRLRG